MAPLNEVLFILSDTRSGSTLLDQLLGAHPSIVSVGEVIWLRAYVREDRTLYNPAHPLLCTCGAPVSGCSFWQQVAATLGQPLDGLKLTTRSAPHRSDARWHDRLLTVSARLPLRFLHAFPRSYRYRFVQNVFGGPQLARDSLKLFDAIFAVSNARFVVDASKSTTRFRSIYDANPHSARAIVLGRDYRAVVHSKVKRGRSLEAAAIGWRKRMIQIEHLTADLPPGRSIRIRYEDLCGEPKVELTRICDFLGLEYASVMLHRKTLDLHHLGGSPSKFDPSKSAIVLDKKHETAFTKQELETMRRLVGRVAESWGY
ncbi:MAG: sulfotransferase [Gammaproteobacteria bacterium]|nr:MAG: sulfotransferase [Gammaproteobacteria bacterium]